MKKASVYTRGGDKGETSLVSGSRVSKGAARIDLYGEVDELNSFIGLACTELEEKNIDEKLHAYLLLIQSRLFDLGSNLACEKEFATKYKLPSLSGEEITKMEEYIDLLNSNLEPLKHFILPGGTKASSLFHVCRTICRRVERSLIRFQSTEELPENSVKFINRLSDFLFICARYSNFLEKKEEHLWKP